jgi:hypothetical protein
VQSLKTVLWRALQFAYAAQLLALHSLALLLNPLPTHVVLKGGALFVKRGLLSSSTCAA